MISGSLGNESWKIKRHISHRTHPLRHCSIPSQVDVHSPDCVTNFMGDPFDGFWTFKDKGWQTCGLDQIGIWLYWSNKSAKFCFVWIGYYCVPISPEEICRAPLILPWETTQVWNMIQNWSYVLLYMILCTNNNILRTKKFLVYVGF